MPCDKKNFYTKYKEFDQEEIQLLDLSFLTRAAPTTAHRLTAYLFYTLYE